MIDQPVPTRMRGQKIILIDDDEFIRDSLFRLFTNRVAHFLAVDSAEKGLAALQESHFDVIICDYNLPGISGLEFFKRIATSHPSSYKILITANTYVLELATQTTIDEVMQKPFSVELIIKSLTDRGLDTSLSGSVRCPQP